MVTVSTPTPPVAATPPRPMLASISGAIVPATPVAATPTAPRSISDANVPTLPVPDTPLRLTDGDTAAGLNAVTAAAQEMAGEIVPEKVSPALTVFVAPSIVFVKLPTMLSRVGGGRDHPADILLSTAAFLFITPTTARLFATAGLPSTTLTLVVLPEFVPFAVASIGSVVNAPVA